MNRITTELQGDGTIIFNSIDADTGEELRYVLTPKAQLQTGDRMDNVTMWRRKANGQGLEKYTVTGGGVLTTPAIAALPNGCFVRLRQGLPR